MRTPNWQNWKGLQGLISGFVCLEGGTETKAYLGRRGTRKDAALSQEWPAGVARSRSIHHSHPVS